LDGSPVPTDDNVAVESGLNSTETTAQADTGNNRFRNLDVRHRRSLPSDVVMALANIDTVADNGTYRSETNGWRMLHESSFGHAYEIDLGEGYTVEIHALNA
jgi:hypothetical protein